MSEKLKQVKVNLYPHQHLQIQQLAKDNNVTIAQYIREKLALELEEKDTRKAYKKHDEKLVKVADPKLLYNLSKIGNNLNQIAKQLNSKKEVSSIEILESLVSIENEIKGIK